MKRARYNRKAPSGLTINGREVKRGEVVDGPPCLVRTLLKRKGWSEPATKKTATPESVMAPGDTPTHPAGVADITAGSKE